MKKIHLILLSLVSFASSAASRYDKNDFRTMNIYVNSIPKCGTHLLTRCVELLTERPLVELPENLVATDRIPAREGNEFFATHVRYSKEAVDIFNKYEYKTFFIYRDPRDRVVSLVNWVYKGGWNQRLAKSPLRKLPFSVLLTHFIKRVKKDYDAFLAWAEEKNCCVVRFENLVGPQGGGDFHIQIKEIQKIAHHIQCPINGEVLSRCVTELFGGGPTFHSGQIGSWKQHFDEHHRILFKKIAGQLLIDLGYETSFDW